MILNKYKNIIIKNKLRVIQKQKKFINNKFNKKIKKLKI